MGSLLGGFTPPTTPYNDALDQMVTRRAQAAQAPGSLNVPGLGQGASSTAPPPVSRPGAYGTTSQPWLSGGAPAPAPAPAPTAGYAAPPSAPAAYAAPQAQNSAPWSKSSNQQQAASGKDQQYWGGVWQGITGDDAKQLNDYIQFLYSMPDYKGRNEANRAAIALYARNLRQNAGQGGLHPEDYQAIAGLGDSYNSLEGQLTAEMAARGQAGGVVAGGVSNLRGKEGGAIGDLLANVTRQARQERLQRELAQMGFDQQMIAQATANNRQDQLNKGGFWKDLLGVAGTVGGALIGGPGGAAVGGSIGQGVGGAVSGNNGYSDYGQPGSPYNPYDPYQR